MIDNVMYVFYTPHHVLLILGEAVSTVSPYHILITSGFLCCELVLGILDSLLVHRKFHEKSVFFIQIRT